MAYMADFYFCCINIVFKRKILILIKIEIQKEAEIK
jgi:hypothetical protein